MDNHKDWDKKVEANHKRNDKFIQEFEEWLNQNPNASINDFKFNFKKMSASGSLFDLEKLINISRNYIINFVMYIFNCSHLVIYCTINHVPAIFI